MILLAQFALFGLQTPDSLSVETNRLFSWIDSLGYVREIERPFVKVPSADEKWEPNTFGFLLRESDKTFEVLTPNLAVFTFFKKPSKDKLYRNGYERVNFKTLLDNTLFNLSQVSGRGKIKPDLSHYELGSLAWICKRRQLNAQSDALVRIVSRQEVIRTGKEDALTPSEVVASAKGRLLCEIMHPLILKFADPELSLTQIQGEFLRVAARLKDTSDSKEFLEIANNLKEAIVEERAHANINIKALPRRNQILEYIWRLSQVGAHNFGDPSPVQELEKFGKDAIDLLKVALDDNRYTRTLRRDGKAANSLMMPDDIFRVRDYARQILDNINKRL